MFDSTANVASEAYADGLRIYDKNSHMPCVVRAWGQPAGNGLAIQARRTISNTNYYNSIRMVIDSSGNPVIILIPTATAPGAWRKALGLCYAVNDTFVATKLTLNGLMTNDSKALVFNVVVPKFLENITTVTVMTMTGALRGVKGYLDSTSGDVDLTANAFTITPSIPNANGNSVTLRFDKNVQFGNSTNNTPVAFYGSVTLKFT